jgi:hypothetical protein
VRGHEVDHVRCDLFGRTDQIALALPVLVIRHQDEPAFPDVFDSLLDGSELHNTFLLSFRKTVAGAALRLPAPLSPLLLPRSPVAWHPIPVSRTSR